MVLIRLEYLLPVRNRGSKYILALGFRFAGYSSARKANPRFGSAEQRFFPTTTPPHRADLVYSGPTGQVRSLFQRRQKENRVCHPTPEIVPTKVSLRTRLCLHSLLS